MLLQIISNSDFKSLSEPAGHELKYFIQYHIHSIHILRIYVDFTT